MIPITTLERSKKSKLLQICNTAGFNPSPDSTAIELLALISSVTSRKPFLPFDQVKLIARPEDTFVAGFLNLDDPTKFFTEQFLKRLLPSIYWGDQGNQNQYISLEPADEPQSYFLYYDQRPLIFQQTEQASFRSCITALNTYSATVSKGGFSSRRIKQLSEADLLLLARKLGLNSLVSVREYLLQNYNRRPWISLAQFGFVNSIIPSQDMRRYTSLILRNIDSVCFTKLDRFAKTFFEFCPDDRFVNVSWSHQTIDTTSNGLYVLLKDNQTANLSLDDTYCLQIMLGVFNLCMSDLYGDTAIF